MSKVGSAEKKELELRQQRAEARKAELELEREELRTLRERRSHQESYEFSPSARGVFYFNGIVNEDNCALVAHAVQRFAHLNEGSPIMIYLNTPGGYVFPGLALYDELRTLSGQGHRITTAIRGHAASMGGILLQAGDRRLVGTESHLMIHEMASGTAGKVHKMKDDLKFDEQLNRRLMAILASRSSKWDADSLYEKIEAKDWWLSAEEAVEQGFADGVG